MTSAMGLETHHAQAFSVAFELDNDQNERDEDAIVYA